MNTFYVLHWDFNHDALEHYDVLPYFRECYKEKKEKPKTFEEFKEFIEHKSQYRFWSRCEYEMICHGWPVRKNDYKLDIHEQIMMNIDVITNILFKEYESSTN
jgi:hypothetical protein